MRPPPGSRRPRVPAAALAALALLAAGAAGCVPLPPRDRVVVRPEPDPPALRAALVRAGFEAGSGAQGAVRVVLADVAPPEGEELVLAWESPGSRRAGIAVHRLARETAGCDGGDARALLHDGGPAGGYAGGLDAGLLVRDVTGDGRPDVVTVRGGGPEAPARLEIFAASAGAPSPSSMGSMGSMGSLERVALLEGDSFDVRDLDGDRVAEVAVSRVIAGSLRGFPEIWRLEPGGPRRATRSYPATMPDAARAYAGHVRAATPDPQLRAFALGAAARYLRGLGHETEAAALESESGTAAAGGGAAAPAGAAAEGVPESP
ncbi:MAG: hypothetical protein L0216_08510 [Planctomycetales bacterium]|nr:hypothetical protein [Planctomycetales bacterium]